MAIYPGARVDLITAGVNSRRTLDRVDGHIKHTIVGGASGCIAMFQRNGYGGSNSHFVIAGDGTVTQLVDTKYRANCQVDGNWRFISTEHEDMGKLFPDWNTNNADNVPAFTDAQIDAQIDLDVWLAGIYDYPIRLMQSSLTSERGIGYHKLGCDPIRVSGGEKWSSSYGKGCPGPKRIDQLKTLVIPGIQKRLAPAPIPTPAPSTRRSSDMFLFRRSDPKSGVRLFTSAAKPMMYDFSDENAAEIAKALKDPAHVAEVGQQGYDELVKALGK